MSERPLHWTIGIGLSWLLGATVLRVPLLDGMSERYSDPMRAPYFPVSLRRSSSDAEFMQ